MKDILTGIFCIAFSLFVFGLATTFPHSPKIYNSPAVYPQALVILLFILAIILIFSGIQELRKAPPQFHAPNDLTKPLLISATLVGYLILLLTSNFVIATIIFLLLIYRLLGGSWKAGVVFSVLLTIGEFLMFGSILKVPLP
jgi:cobalamin synthase